MKFLKDQNTLTENVNTDAISQNWNTLMMKSGVWWNLVSDSHSVPLFHYQITEY